MSHIIDLNKEPLVADCFNVGISSPTLLYISRDQGVYNNAPYYTLYLSLNGSSLKVSTTKELYDSFATLQPQTPLASITFSINLRYKKFKVVEAFVSK